MHIEKVFIELKRRKQVENLAVFVELKRKKQDCLQFSIRYQETKLFGGYFSHLFLLSWTKTARFSTCFLLLSSIKTFSTLLKGIDEYRTFSV
jgi:hypothetical protein